MAGVGVAGAGEGVVTGREGARCPLAVDTRRLAGDNLAAGDVISTTQSAVVLENLISQFLYSKAADGPSAKEAP